MKSLTTAQAQQKIAKLNQMLEELKAPNFNFAINITRLRAINSLCEDEKDLHHFAFFIAEKAFQRVVDNPKLTDEIKEAGTRSMELMDANLEAIKEQGMNEMRQLHRQLQSLQNQTRKAYWNTEVRSIPFWDVYLMEACVNCFFTNHNPNLGYELARDYCQKYNPSYGSGLRPESIPFLEEVVGFWRGGMKGEKPATDARKTALPSREVATVQLFTLPHIFISDYQPGFAFASQRFDFL